MSVDVEIILPEVVTASDFRAAVSQVIAGLSEPNVEWDDDGQGVGVQTSDAYVTLSFYTERDEDEDRRPYVVGNAKAANWDRLHEMMRSLATELKAESFTDGGGEVEVIGAPREANPRAELALSMMLRVNEAKAQLESTMAAVKAINTAKDAQRHLMNDVQRLVQRGTPVASRSDVNDAVAAALAEASFAFPVEVATLDALHKKLRAQLQEMSKESELQALALQTRMAAMQAVMADLNANAGPAPRRSWLGRMWDRLRGKVLRG